MEVEARGVQFGLLPRATLLISLCVLAITHVFAVPPETPTPPQVPPNPTQIFTQPPNPTQIFTQPQVQPSLSQQEQQESLSLQTEAQTVAPFQYSTAGTSGMKPSQENQGNITLGHLQDTAMAPSRLSTSVLQQQSHTPPAPNFTSSYSDLESVLGEGLAQFQPQPNRTFDSVIPPQTLKLTTAPVPELVSLHTDVAVRDPASTKANTVSEQTAEPPRIVETQTAPKTTGQIFFSDPIAVPHVGTSPPEPEHVAATSPPRGDQSGLMTSMASVAPEEEKIFITEIPLKIRPDKPPELEPLITFMGYPISCIQDGMMSCANRCGLGSTSRDDLLRQAEKNENIQPTAGTTYTCKCDSYCVLYGDCCPDYFATCEGLAGDSQVLGFITSLQQTATDPGPIPGYDTSKWVATLYNWYGSCQETSIIHNDVQETHMIWMISSCPIYYNDHDYGGKIVERCLTAPPNRLYSYPVSHLWFPGVIYKNVFCAMCHDVALHDVVFWRLVLHCAATTKDELDYSFEDILDAAERSDSCPIENGARLPDNAEFRTCRAQNVSSPVEYFGGPYVTGCQPNDSGVDPEQEFKVRAACSSVFQPVWNSARGVTFSSVHCAACSGLSDTEIVVPSTCHPISSPPARRHTDAVFAEVEYIYGFIFSTIGTSTNTHHMLCHGEPQDPRSMFMDLCPETQCRPDIRLSEFLSPVQLACSIDTFRYSGRYWDKFPPRDYTGSKIILISKSLFPPSGPLTAELEVYSKGFRDAFRKRCSYNCPNETADVFQSISLNRHGDLKAELLLRGFVVDLFSVLAAADRQVPEFTAVSTETTVRNYQAVTDVCSSDPGLAIPLVDIPIVIHNLQAYAFVNQWGADCFFELDRIGFSLAFWPIDGPPLVAQSIVLCWHEDMASLCNIPSPVYEESTDRTPDRCIPVFDAVAATPVDNSSLQTVTPPPQSPVQSLSQDEIVLRETKVFKTFCLTVCAVASFLSSVCSLASVRASQKSLLTLILVSVSRISLSVAMTLYIVQLNASHTDSKIMAVFMHFGWLVTSISLAAAFIHFQVPANLDVVETSPISIRGTVKWLTVVLLLPAVIVTVCVIEEEESGSVGYSSRSGHLFWMTNQNACYISTVAVIGASFVAALVKLSFQSLLRFLRTRHQSRDAESINDRNTFKTNERKTRGKPENAELMIFLAYMIGLYLAAVLDYADSNKTLWVLMFCVASFSMGLSMLLCVSADLMYTVRSNNEPPACAEITDASDGCSDSSQQLGTAAHARDSAAEGACAAQSGPLRDPPSVLYSPE
ncbi:hypothetical protein EGW08_021914 [Elysia chlorotica]|uniref:SMB domain-containing protein n=1 Tax=Elysia chlorotica TaxID=188477 RepID=A0A3S1H1H7_ELYCH|nr:hypothetical protein EGW08_021914 [Elysia chlorotica]